MGMPFTPDMNDGAVQILREIFGNIVDRLVSSAPTTDAAMSLVGSAFGVFNSGVLVFASIIMMFVTILGITNSANDGEVLGAKWNTFYTPIRTITASGLLIPTASGLSGIQIFILMVALWSSAFASTIWKSVVEYSLTQGIADTVVQSVLENNKFSKMAVDAMRMQSCSHAINLAVNNTLGNVGGMPLELKVISRRKSLADRDLETIEVYYQSPSWDSSKWICGSITFTTTYLKQNESVQDGNPFIATLKDTSSIEQEVHAAVSEVRRKYMLGLFGIGMTSPTAAAVDQITAAALQSGGAGTAQVDSSQLRESLAQRQTEYAQAVRQAVLSYLNTNNTAVINSLSSGGWVYAGAWQRELARIKDSIRTSSAIDYEYDVNRNSLEAVLSGPILYAVKVAMEQFDSFMAPLLQKAVYGLESESFTQNGVAVPSLKSDFNYADFNDGGISVNQHIKTYFNHSFTENTVAWMATYLGRDGADPLMQIKDIGDWLIVCVESYYTAQTALKIAIASMKAGAQTASNGEISGKVGAAVVAGLEAAWQAIIEFASMVSIPMGALIYAGYFMSVWIPMIPAFVFMIGVAGWVIAVAEAVIAGSLWAAMHLTPAKDDSFIGSQSQGYMLLMSVFFRPSLMIMGLVISQAATLPLIKYSNAFFVLSFRLVQTNSVTGLFSMAAFMMAYCFVIFSVLMMLFGLPQTLPDRILRWVGGGVGDMGEQSTMGRIESGSSGQARMAATGMAHKAAAASQAKNAQADRMAQTEQTQVLRDLAEGMKGSEPAGFGNQGVAPVPPPPPPQ